MVCFIDFIWSCEDGQCCQCCHMLIWKSTHSLIKVSGRKWLVSYVRNENVSGVKGEGKRGTAGRQQAFWLLKLSACLSPDALTHKPLTALCLILQGLPISVLWLISPSYQHQHHSVQSKLGAPAYIINVILQLQQITKMSKVWFWLFLLDNDSNLN